MKRILSLLLSLLLACSLVGCAPVLEAVLEAIQSELASTSPTESALPVATPSPTAGNSAAPDSTPATPIPEKTLAPSSAPAIQYIDEDGIYDSKEDVSLYLYNYGKLPSNYITKNDARALGWEGGSLKPYAKDKCIGGDYFGNYEGLLPKASGRTYTECDIGTLGKSSRGIKRIVFSNDGFIYYTEDHYESFELLYGGE